MNETNEPDYIGRIPVFVYGTLQPGEALFPMIEDDILEVPKAAVTFGYKLYENRTNTYPYLVSGTPDDFAFGSLVSLPYGQAWQQVARMEIGAGYHVEQISAYINRPDAEAGLFEVQAVAFILPPSYYWMLGEAVRDNIWREYTKTLEDDTEMIPNSSK